MKKTVIVITLALITIATFGQSKLHSLCPVFGIEKINIKIGAVPSNSSFWEGPLKKVTISATSDVVVNEFAIPSTNVEYLVGTTSRGITIANSEAAGTLHSDVAVTKTSDNVILFKSGGVEISTKDKNFTSKLTASGEAQLIFMLNVLAETQATNGSQIDFTQIFDFSSLSQSCQKTRVAFGGGRSGAEARALEYQRSFLLAHSDCTTVGGVDTSCLFDNHACFSTVFFNCSGSTCNYRPITISAPYMFLN